MARVYPRLSQLGESGLNSRSPSMVLLLSILANILCLEERRIFAFRNLLSLGDFVH